MPTGWAPMTIKVHVKEKIEGFKDELSPTSYSEVLEAMCDYCYVDKSSFKEFWGIWKSAVDRTMEVPV